MSPRDDASAGERRGCRIEAEAVSVVFPQARGEVVAVREASFQLDPGEFACVVGPSGSGKTTLLHALGGLRRPSSGIVRLDGEDVYALSDRERTRRRNQKIGFIFQTYHLHPRLTARRNAALPLALRGAPWREADRAAQAALDALDLGEWAEAYAGDLSAGQKQRVVAARALVTEPSLILADEPTANLDEASARLVLDALLQANRERGATLVVVSHQADLLPPGARVLAMEEGRVKS